VDLGVWAIVSWEEWVRHNRLFAAGLAAALMLGAASPALADAANGKGKAKGHVNKPEKQKPTKKVPETKGKKGGVSGGGYNAGGEFSIQARLRSKSKGNHFNYTSIDGLFKVRCRDGFQDFAPVGNTATVTFNKCLVTGQADRMDLTVTVTDNGQPPKTDPGQPSATPTLTDWMGFSVTVPAVAPATTPTTTSYEGNLTGGNIKVRP
jgi:hypothetical protein